MSVKHKIIESFSVWNLRDGNLTYAEAWLMTGRVRDHSFLRMSEDAVTHKLEEEQTESLWHDKHAHSGGKKKHPTESQFLESASCHQWPWTVFPANVCGVPYVETRTSKSMRELHESVLSRHFTHTPMWSTMCWEQQVINCSCSAGRRYEEGAACRGRWKGFK